jgi:hypothetical protein
MTVNGGEGIGDKAKVPPVAKFVATGFVTKEVTNPRSRATTLLLLDATRRATATTELTVTTTAIPFSLEKTSLTCQKIYPLFLDPSIERPWTYPLTCELG